MKKILSPEQAVQHECCVMVKKCIGLKCMAWVQEVECAGKMLKQVQGTLHKSKHRDSSLLTQEVSPPVFTGKGFCGMVSN